MSTDPLTLALLAGGGYVAVKSGALDKFFGGGQLPPESVKEAQLAYWKSVSLANQYEGSATKVSTTNQATVTQTPTTTEKSPSTAEQELLTAAKEKLREEWASWSCEQKKSGAAKLNAMAGYTVVQADQACDIDFDKAFAAAGAASGAAGCAALGVTAAASPVCAMVGAYVGKEVGEWLTDDLYPWIKGTWDEVVSWFD